MTHASTRRAEPLPLLLTAAFAGAVVLAFADAPQSLGMMFRVGLDNPDFAGEQLIIAVFGAICTAAGVLLARWWRLLLASGALGVLVAHLVNNEGWTGLTMRAYSPAEPGQTAVPPDFVRELVWACLLVGSSGLLLIGVLGAAQRVYRAHPAGASVAAVAACAGYLGVSVVGPLRGADAATGRLIVLVIAVILTGAALLNRELAEPAGLPGPLRRPAQLAAAGAVLLTVTPALLVSISGEQTFGTWVGGLLGLAITAGAVAAAALIDGNTIIATVAAGLALSAPIGLLAILADALVAGDGDGGTALGLLGLLGVAIAAVLAAGRLRMLFAAAVLAFTGLLLAGLAAGVFDFADESGGFLAWTVLIACIATVGSVVGSTAPFLANRAALPAAGAIITAMALGINGILNFTRVGPQGPSMDMTFGTGGFLVSAGMLLAAAGLLILLSRQDRVRTTGPVDDYRRVFTSFGPPPAQPAEPQPGPPETR